MFEAGLHLTIHVEPPHASPAYADTPLTAVPRPIVPEVRFDPASSSGREDGDAPYCYLSREARCQATAVSALERRRSVRAPTDNPPLTYRTKKHRKKEHKKKTQSGWS